MFCSTPPIAKGQKRTRRKRITKAWQAKARVLLEAEVSTYDDYLTNSYFGFTIEQDNVVIDSCWGFAGDDFEESGLINTAKDYVDQFTACGKN